MYGAIDVVVRRRDVGARWVRVKEEGMFNKSAPQPQATTRAERNEQSFLQNGVRLKGEIEVDGDLRIEGTVEGTLNTRGVLMLGPKASVEGDIRGREVVIHGRLAGTIRADERIHLARGAKVKGDLYCRSLVIEEGVFFEGRSHMGEPTGQKTADGRASATGQLLPGGGYGSTDRETSDARLAATGASAQHRGGHVGSS
jgi:cytoskeletal protein CcmA (bactofilin family)